MRRLSLFILAILGAPGFCWGTYNGPGGLPHGYDQSDVVILGKAERVESDPKYDDDSIVSNYLVSVEAVYKGVASESTIPCVDFLAHTSAGRNVPTDRVCVFFLKTAESERMSESDRQRLADRYLIHGVMRIEPEEVPAFETSIERIETYRQLTDDDAKRAFLLPFLKEEDLFVQNMMLQEIMQLRLPEARPYYEQKLLEAERESQTLWYLRQLHFLGDTTVADTLLARLHSPDAENRVDVMNTLYSLNERDPSIAPEIRKFIHDPDELVATNARTILLRLQQPDALELCLEMIQNSENSTARYNSIHHLNWGTRLDFTPEQLALIQSWTNDENESIARVAGFILEREAKKAAKLSQSE